MSEEVPTIIIDNGSLYCKTGFSCKAEPSSTFFSLIGFPKIHHMVYDPNRRPECLFGNNVWKKHPILINKRLVKRGINTQYDFIENFYDYVFSQELKIDPSEHPIINTETSFNPKELREKIAEIIFEKFNAPSYLTGNDAVFSFYASGKTTGIAFESGFGVSNSVPIIDGYPVRDAMINIPIGGCDMLEYLISLFGPDYLKSLYWLGFSHQLNEVKEKYCYVAYDYEKEIQKSENTSDLVINYDLPDYFPITMNKERFTSSEIFFKPQIQKLNCDGIDKAIHNSILKCNSDIQDILFSNILLSGGTSLLKGLKERIEKEMKILSQNKKSIGISSHHIKEHSAWSGASLFSSSSKSKELFISQNEYKENGAQIVHQKRI